MKHSRAVLGLSAAALIALSTARYDAQAAPPVGHQFTFAIMGDNRPAKTHMPPTPPFQELAKQIRLRHPAFVISSGDIIHGDKNDLAEVTREYDDVIPIFKSMGVPVYYVVGNHEIHSSQEDETLYRKRAQDRMFFSFDHGNSHFVLLDSERVGEEHRIASDQLDWLKKDLAAARPKCRHIFVFAHEPAFPIAEHVGSSLDAFPQDRDAFWALLKSYRVDAFISGHEHVYWDSVHDGVEQIISGGAGAPMYPTPNGPPFHHFILATVNGDTVKYQVVKLDVAVITAAARKGVD